MARNVASSKGQCGIASMASYPTMASTLEGVTPLKAEQESKLTTKEAMWEDTESGLMNFAQFQTALAQMEIDDAASASGSGAAEQNEPVFESAALAGSVSE